jgi:hypothetical protein
LEIVISDPPAADWPARRRLGEDWLGAVVGCFRVTVQALKRRNNGFYLQHLNSDEKSTDGRKVTKVFRETLDLSNLNLR